ncbi:unnamed protein product [Phaeothamnion confervicola]
MSGVDGTAAKDGVVSEDVMKGLASIEEEEDAAAKLMEAELHMATNGAPADGAAATTGSAAASTAAAAAAAAAAAGAPAESVEENSVYVGQVDYDATPEELQEYFQGCGTINRVTILCDKMTGRPKGYAYIEFQDKGAVDLAILMNDTTFKGRQLKVTQTLFNLSGSLFRLSFSYFSSMALSLGVVSCCCGSMVML